MNFKNFLEKLDSLQDVSEMNHTTLRIHFPYRVWIIPEQYISVLGIVIDETLKQLELWEQDEEYMEPQGTLCERIYDMRFQKTLYSKYCSNNSERCQYTMDRYNFVLSSTRVYEYNGMQVREITSDELKLNKIKLAVMILLHKELIKAWIELYPGAYESAYSDYKEKLEKKRSAATNKKASNFKTPEKIQVKAEHIAKQKLVEKLELWRILGNEKLHLRIDCEEACYLDGRKSPDDPDYLPLWIIQDDCKLYAADPSFHFISWLDNENPASPPEYDFYQSVRQWYLNYGWYSVINKEENKQYTTRIIDEYLVENGRLSYSNLQVFFKLVHKFLKFESEELGLPKRDIYVDDILDGLRSYIQTSRDCYILVALKHILFKNDDYAGIANWISKCASNNLDIEDIKMDPDNILESLENILHETLFRPAVMEPILIRNFMNFVKEKTKSYTCVSKKGWDSDADEIVITTDKIIADLKKITKNAVNIRFQSNKLEGKDILVREDLADLVFDMICKRTVDLFDVGKGALDKKYKFSRIAELPNEWVSKNHEDFIDPYISMVGYNTCIELLWGLNKICIFKDSYADYEDGLYILISQITRYIKILGSQTAVIVHQIFSYLEQVNKEYKIWKFSRKDPTDGKQVIQLVTSVLRKCQIENITSDLAVKYFSALCCSCSIKSNIEDFYNNSKEGRKLEIKNINSILSQSQKKVIKEKLSEEDILMPYFDESTVNDIAEMYSQDSDIQNKVNSLIMSIITKTQKDDWISTLEEKYFSTIFYTVNKKYKLEERYYELIRENSSSKQKQWNVLRISNEAGEYIAKYLECDISKKRPTDTLGRWYCVLQKWMIIHLNNL